MMSRPDPGRILVLVPHEPTDDPRIQWVTDLCARVARTDVLGSTFSTALQAREYSGNVYLERVNIAENASLRVVDRANRLGGWYRFGSVQTYERNHGLRRNRGPLGFVQHQSAATLRHLANNASNSVFTDALYRRARALSIAPRLIICHDIYALAAGVRLKSVFNCRLIYDSHEFWPEADLISQTWQHGLVSRYEGRLIKQADAVVTVSPPLARRLEALYNRPHVISCPNAEPFDPDVRTSAIVSDTKVVKFLVQGRVAPRRGYDELLSAWERLDDERAVLYIRCPRSEHLQVLRARHARLEASGRVVILPPVSVDELVSAASFADVGLITYPAETKAHLEACPNKLSQFMHAGLAILANELPYVTSVTTRAQCGLSFDLNDPSSLVRAVRSILDNPAGLAEMKRNSRRAGEEWFNWECQSMEYASAIERLFGGQTLN